MFEEHGFNSMLQQVLINHTTAERGVCTQRLQGPSPAAVQSAGRQTQQELRGPVYFQGKELSFCFCKVQWDF